VLKYGMLFTLDTSLQQLRKRLRDASQQAVLASIIRTKGSTYRKFGARMLIEADGRLTGLLSGGCMEQDLIEHARHVSADLKPRLVQYDHQTEDDPIFGIGAGCEGAMDILLEPLSPQSSAHQALQDVFEECDTKGVSQLTLITDPADPDFGTHGPTYSRALTGVDHIHETVTPPPYVLIAGAGLDVQPLAHFLDQLHWRVELIDHRIGLLQHPAYQHLTAHHCPTRQLPRTINTDRVLAAIIMSHHLESDLSYLNQFSKTSIPYVGLLGPKARREKLLSLMDSDDRARLQPRLHAPIGIKLGAITPEGIALSIVAQLHEFSANHLKNNLP